MLAYTRRCWIKPRAASAGENNTFHRISFSPKRTKESIVRVIGKICFGLELLGHGLRKEIAWQPDMPKFEVKKEEIAEELRRLLNLKYEIDLVRIIKQVDVHNFSRGFYVSFKNTNKYLLGYITENANVLPTIGAQRYSNFSGCCLNIVYKEVVLIAGYKYDPLKIIDLKKIKFEITMALLDAVSIS